MAECLVGQLLDLNESQDKPAEPALTTEPQTTDLASDKEPNKPDTPQEDDVFVEIKPCQDLSIEESRADKSLSTEKLLSPGAMMKEDIKLIDQEEFDFDLPVSPSEAEVRKSDEGVRNSKKRGEEEDDEIFFGPMGYTEQLVAKVVAEEEKETESYKPLSPLSAEEMVKLFHEAQLLAHHISSARSASSSSEESNRAVKSFTFGAGKNSTGDSPLGVPLEDSKVTPRRRQRKGTFTFDSPLDTLSQNLKKSLPEENSKMEQTETAKSGLVISQLQFDPDETGPIKFTACGKGTNSDSACGSLRKSGRTPGSGSKLAQRRSGRTPGSGQKPQQKKSGLLRPGSLKPPQTKPNTSAGIGSCVQIQKRRSISPQSLKRRRLGSDESVDDENASIMSEESECSASVPSGSKRTLPQPRSRISRMSSGMAPPTSSSRMAAPSRGGHVRTLSNSSTSSTCSNVSTKSASSVPDSRLAAPKPVGGLRRSSSFSKIALPSTAGASKPPPMGSRLQRQGSLRRPSSIGRGAVTTGLPKPGALTKPPPITKPSSGIVKPPSPRSGVAPPRTAVNRPVASNGPKPASSVPNPGGAAAGSRGSAVRKSLNESTVSSVQPTIKGQMTKLQLLKPGTLQRKTLSATRSLLGQSAAKAGSGPLKAVIRDKSVTATSACQAAEAGSQLKKAAERCGTPVKPKEAGQRGRKTSGSTQLHTTPVKLEKNVQPRKLMQPSPGKSAIAGTPKRTSASTPRKSSDSGLSTGSSTPVMTEKRRSFLPTPKSCRSMSIGSNTSAVSERSSVSSIDSDSQVFVGSKSPAVGVLIDLNGLDPNSPSCMKSRRAKVMHTPVGGNKENQKMSLWSPVRRKKPINPGDEFILCTKKTYQLGHY